jgi:hypothetical protein
MNGTNASPKSIQIENECAALAASVTYQTIPLKGLVTPDFLYVKSTAGASMSPIQANAPLTVVRAGRGNYSIIDGCKRFMRFKNERRTGCACGVIAASASPLHRGMLRILYNRGRPLDLAEQVCFLKWLKEHFGFEDSTRICDLLGITRPHMAEMENLLLYDADVQAAVFEHRIHPANVIEFGALSKSDRSCFQVTFHDLGLSQQTEREILEWLLEISIGQKKSIAGLLSSEEMLALVKNSTLNAPQKIDRIRNHFFFLRFPAYSRALAQWKSLVREVNPDPAAVHFISDPFFEKNRLKLSISVSKPDQAARVLRNLSEITEKQWLTLIDPLE